MMCMLQEKCDTCATDDHAECDQLPSVTSLTHGDLGHEAVHLAQLVAAAMVSVTPGCMRYAGGESSANV
jgi:hypothetical protein